MGCEASDGLKQATLEKKIRQGHRINQKTKGGALDLAGGSKVRRVQGPDPPPAMGPSMRDLFFIRVYKTPSISRKLPI